MAFARSAAVIALRSQFCTQSRRTISSKHLLRSTRPVLHKTVQPSLTLVRWKSAPATESKVYDFHQIKKLCESPSSDTIIIDVREPSEYRAGYIPNAVNLPVGSQPAAIFLPEDEFEQNYGFEKPAADKELVFYCRAGIRSNTAAQLARQQGYTNVAEYKGSWLDWEKNGGPTAQP